jgi:hypothetical protein
VIYVVLGMHKSGTTLVARLLHESGIDMGEFDPRLGYGEGNTFERHEAQAVNRALLRGCLVPPVDYLLRRPFRPAVDRAGYPPNRDSQSIVRRRALERRLATPEAAAAIDAIVAGCRDHADWGFKDPRTALTYAAWRGRLPEHRLVVVYRSLAQALQRARTGPRHPARSFRVLHAWTVHNWMILRALETTRQASLVLRYEDLMAGDEGVKRLSAFVGRPIRDVRDPALYRSRTTADPPGWASALAPLLPIDPVELERRLHALAETGS